MSTIPMARGLDTAGIRIYARDLRERPLRPVVLPGDCRGDVIATEARYMMRARVLLAALVSSGLAVAALLVAAGQVKAPDFKPPSDLKWMDLDPTGAPGVTVAPLWGDFQKGAFRIFLKLPAGFTGPLHRHTHDMRLVIVSGTYIQAPEGKPEVRLGPGSYLMQPGGEYRHITRCGKAADCVLYVEGDGAFDLHPVKGGPVPRPE